MADASDDCDPFLQELEYRPAAAVETHQEANYRKQMLDKRKRGFSSLNVVVTEAVFDKALSSGSGVLCPLTEDFLENGEEADPLPADYTFNFVLTAGHCVTRKHRGRCVTADSMRIRIPKYKMWKGKAVQSFKPGPGKKASKRFQDYRVGKDSIFVYPGYEQGFGSYDGCDFALVLIPDHKNYWAPNHFQIWDTAVKPDGFSIVGFPFEKQYRYLPYFDRRPNFREFVESDKKKGHVNVYYENSTSSGQSGGPIEFISLEMGSKTIVGIHVLGAEAGEASGNMITEKIFDWMKSAQAEALEFKSSLKPEEVDRKKESAKAPELPFKSSLKQEEVDRKKERAKDPELVSQVIKTYGSDVQAKDSEGKTSLMRASGSGDTTAVRVLVKLGADVHAKNNYLRRTSLHAASYNGQEAVVRALVELGADVNAKDIDGWTSLHWASNRGHETVVRALVELGADVNAKNNDGNTSLYWASNNGHEAVVRALVELGADVNAKNNKGRTSLHWASRNGHEAVVRVLKEAGSK